MYLDRMYSIRAILRSRIRRYSTVYLNICWHCTSYLYARLGEVHFLCDILSGKGIRIMRLFEDLFKCVQLGCCKRCPVSPLLFLTYAGSTLLRPSIVLVVHSWSSSTLDMSKLWKIPLGSGRSGRADRDSWLCENESVVVQITEAEIDSKLMIIQLMVNTNQ